MSEASMLPGLWLSYKLCADVQIVITYHNFNVEFQ